MIAENTDVMITVSGNIEQLLKDLQNVEKALKQTQSTIDSQLNPSTTSFGTRVTTAGTKVKELGATIKQKIGTEGALAFSLIGAAASSFTKQCVQSAISAESSWTRMNALLQSSTDGTSISLDSAKTKIRQYSSEWGYMVSDTRAAANSLLETGLSASKLDMGLKATAGLASRTGMSMEEASNMVSKALIGQGRNFERLTGLKLKDYQDSQGNIDQQRLMADLYNTNSEAIKAHANTTEAAVARMNTAWGGLKTSIGEALLPLVNTVADVVTQIANWFKALPDGVKSCIATFLVVVAGIASAIGVLGFLAPVFTAIGDAIILFGSVIGMAAGPIATLVGNILVVSAAGGGLTGVLGVIGGALVGLLSPLLSILAPILAVGAAFYVLYKAGQHFGLWKDLGGMLSTIGSTLMWVGQQVWNFASALVGGIVQAVTIAKQRFDAFLDIIFTVADVLMGNISISDAFSKIIADVGVMMTGGLSGIISDEMGRIAEAFANPGAILDAVSSTFQAVVDWALGILGIASPGFIARAIQEEMEHIADFIRGAFDAIVGAITWIAQGILNAFMSIPGWISQTFMNIVATIQAWLLQARMTAQMLILQLVLGVITRFNTLVARVRMAFQTVVNAIRSRLVQARAIAGNLAGMVRTAIVTRFNAIVAKVRSIFQKVVSTIRQRLANAVNSAKEKARAIYEGIKTKVAEIPSIVKEEFDKIKDKIKTALDNAKNTAVSCINDLVASVKSALGIASPGYIQRMMTYEFTSIPLIISEQGNKAIREAQNMAEGIVKTWDNGIGDGLTSNLNVEMEALQKAGNIMPQLIPTDVLHSTITDMMSATRINPAQSVTNKNMRTYTHNNSTKHEIHYHVQTMNFNMADMERNEIEKFYSMLDGLSRGL